MHLVHSNYIGQVDTYLPIYIYFVIQTMKYSYINKEWNLTETEDVLEAPAYLELIWTVYFDKRVAVSAKKEKVEAVEEGIIAEVAKEVNTQELEAKEYLRAKKIRWFALLKWESLMKRAIEEGFIIQ